MQAGETAATASAEKVFDIGIDERLSYDQLLILGLQNIFGMTGMFIIPGILGRSFNLPPEQIAYLYGMTFLVCGFVTVLQSALLLRLPIVQGPYAGSFASMLAVGHRRSDLVLSLPVRGYSVIGLLARFLRAPINERGHCAIRRSVFLRLNRRPDAARRCRHFDVIDPERL